MKAFKGIPSWAFLLGLLLIANLGWMAWNAHRFADLRGAGKRFKVEVLQTNGVSGVGLFSRLKGGQNQPLWTEFDFNQDGKPDMESYFFRGHTVFEINLSSNGLPRYGVYFWGEGKSATWWLDRRSSGSFTERISYDTNGIPVKHEVWYQDAWHVVDRRNEKGGVIIDGEWQRLTFGTNGMWMIDTNSKGHL